MDAAQQQVLAQIDPDELIDMVKDLVSIPSPTGGEREVGEYLAARFADIGLKVMLQEVETGRNNVVGTWRGVGDGEGATLMFLGHMDTAPGIAKPGAQMVDGKWIAGFGASNMKSAFACYYMATKMLRRAGVEPRGDVYLAGVVGEIERGPVGPYQGPGCRGAGYGARYLASHGFLPDLIINGEPTGLRVQIANGGYMFIRLTTRGITQHASYRQFGVDAIAKMERVLPAVRAWESEYQAKFPHPFIRPRVNVGAIEGGYPPSPQLVANTCHAYVDVMLLPATDILAVKREVEALVRRINANDPDLGLEMDVYTIARGYEIKHDEYIAETVRAAHRLVTGRDPVEPEAERFGVSSDNWVFWEYGTRGITYGPAGISRVIPGAYAAYDPEFGEVVNVDDLVTCTRVYALAALDLVTKKREEVIG